MHKRQQYFEQLGVGLRMNEPSTAARPRQSRGQLAHSRRPRTFARIHA
jgi:hypothetical protein